MLYFHTWTKQAVTQESGAVRTEVAGSGGCWITLADGRRILDAMSSNFQAAFGHSCEPVKMALHRQIDEMPLASPKHDFALKRTVSEKLCALVDKGPGRIFYTVSGAESVENALKMAREVTGRDLICARRKSYHGASMGAMSVTGDWRGEKHFGVQSATLRIPEPADDPELVETRKIVAKAGPENIAAMCLETITGMNGVIIPPETWWRGVQEICRSHGILLITDEVSSGFGRTGKALAIHHYDALQPDFVCMGKAISAGYIPFGAVWVREEIASWYDHRVLSAGLTAYAHPMGLAAANSVLNMLNDAHFEQHLRATCLQFGAGVSALRNHPRVKTTRCVGMMAAIELEPGAAITPETGIQHGLHLAAKENLIILAPPLVISKDECDELFRRVGAMLNGGIPA